MQVTLTTDQRQWLEKQVAAGRYPTVDAAALAIIDERMSLETAGLDWARPLLDAARAGIGRGEYSRIKDVDARLEQRIHRLSGV